MLWLCLHPPALSLAALMPPPGQALAVTDRRGHRRWAVACTEDRVAPGTDLGRIQALYPRIGLHARARTAERELLVHLAYWAYRYGQPVSLELREADWDYGLPLPAVWVEIGASRRLFGGLEALLSRLRHEAAEAWPMPLALGVAPTPEAALLVARRGHAGILDDLPSLHQWLARQPLQALPLAPALLASLAGSGFTRLGEVLALPAEVLAHRFESGLVDYLARLSGRRADPRRALQPPPVYRRRFQLLGEVTHTEGLLFPLQRLLAELQHYLRARDTGVQQLDLYLAHPHRPSSIIELAMSAATRDARHLSLLLRERLSRVVLEAPVREIELVAEHFVAPDTPQLDLFDDRRRQARVWHETVEKLIARLGPENVWSLGLAGAHRPEKSWRRVAPQDEPIKLPQYRSRARPTWLIEPPRRLPHAPARLGSVERIESGWWDGADAVRDYYVARLDEGVKAWVYREPASDGWFVQGLWA